MKWAGFEPALQRYDSHNEPPLTERTVDGYVPEVLDLEPPEANAPASQEALAALSLQVENLSRQLSRLGKAAQLHPEVLSLAPGGGLDLSSTKPMLLEHNAAGKEGHCLDLPALLFKNTNSEDVRPEPEPEAELRPDTISS